MSQRKSVGRRRSRSLCGLQAKDFCETIPKDIPESERLLKLIDMSFKYALKEAVKHAKVKEDFDSSSFLAKGDDCLENAKAIVIEKGLHKSAVENDGEDLEETGPEENQCIKDIELFEEESKKWDNLVTAYRENLQKEMNASYSIDTSTIERNENYNYDDIMKETSIMDEELSDKISSLCHANSAIKAGLKLSTFYEETKLKDYCERYHQEIQNSPASVIRRLNSAQ